MPLRNVTTQEIRSIEALDLAPNATTDCYQKSHPVFLVTFRDAAKLVLKAESRSGAPGRMGDQSARWAGKLMYTVSDYTKVDLLSPTEIQQLKNVPQSSFAPANRQTVARSYLVDLLSARGFGFYKMPYVENMKHMEGMVKKGRGLELLAKLRDDRSVLLNLAKIVAVDLFIGNYDRFTETGEVGNATNVLFQEGNNKLDPVGVDFYYAEEEASKLFKDPPPNWAGLRLQSQQTLRWQAERMVAGLNAYFKKELGDQVQDNQLIRMMSIGTVTNGLVEGAQTLKAYLLGRMQGGKKLPSGVTKRMYLLHWI